MKTDHTNTAEKNGEALKADHTNTNSEKLWIQGILKTDHTNTTEKNGEALDAVKEGEKTSSNRKCL